MSFIQRTHNDQIVRELPENTIFLFGSNLLGRHGLGSALTAARYFGATEGQGWGFSGQSFAFPTKGKTIQSLSLRQIEFYAEAFLGIVLKYSVTNPEVTFYVTRVGCGLAGYTDEEIAPLFISMPNVIYPESWVSYLITHA